MRGVQTVVHRGHGQAQERGDVLLRAVVDVKEHHDLEQGARQVRDGREDGPDLLVPFEAAISADDLRGYGVHGREWHDLELLASQHAMRLMADDRAQPGGESRRFGKCRQRVPGGDEGFLNDVFGLLEVAAERDRVAKGHVLKPPGDLGERVQVAAPCLSNQSFQVHGCPHPISARIRGRALAQSFPSPPEHPPVTRLESRRSQVAVRESNATFSSLHRELEPFAPQSITATASISIRAPGMARPATWTRVLAGGLEPKNSWRTSP